MKQLLRTLLLISLTVCFITGCREPAGGIAGDGIGDGGSGDLEFLWLVPNRFLYETEEQFDRYNDFQVMYAAEGVVRSIPTNNGEVAVELIRYTILGPEMPTIPLNNRYHSFLLAGRYEVQVTYRGMTEKYSIEVRGSFVNPGDGSDFIDIIWL